MEKTLPFVFSLNSSYFSSNREIVSAVWHVWYSEMMAKFQHDWWVFMNYGFAYTDPEQGKILFPPPPQSILQGIQYPSPNEIILRTRTATRGRRGSVLHSTVRLDGTSGRNLASRIGRIGSGMRKRRWSRFSRLPSSTQFIYSN